MSLYKRDSYSISNYDKPSATGKTLAATGGGSLVAYGVMSIIPFFPLIALSILVVGLYMMMR